jgi:hypothetical protein
MGDTMISVHRIARRLSATVGLGLLGLGSLHAQVPLATTSARWLAWAGCWQQTDAPVINMPVVCIVPTSSVSAVDVVTVDSGKVVSRYTVDASGQHRAVNRDGCTGWESARWSADSLRVFLSSDLMCGALKRTSNGIMAISPNGEWVTVDAVTAGGNEAVRGTHYRQAAVPSQLTPELASAATLGVRLDRRAAAIAAGGKLTPKVIVEAIRALDTATVQAWLVERNEKFEVTAKTLIALADAGVPGSVTDVMVAAAYPEEFHFSRSPAPAAMTELSQSDSARIAADYLIGRNSCDPLSYYSPYGWGINPCSDYNAYRYGSPYARYGYGYSPFGYGYGYGYGAGFGAGYGPGYYSGVYTGPVVIVQNNSDAGHGRAVKGQGYTRSSGGSASSGSSGSYAPSSSSSSGSSSASSGSSAGSSSAGSSSSSGRTAVARPPLD